MTSLATEAMVNMPMDVSSRLAPFNQIAKRDRAGMPTNTHGVQHPVGGTVGHENGVLINEIVQPAKVFSYLPLRFFVGSSHKREAVLVADKIERADGDSCLVNRPNRIR